jgi:hypothetical protein
VSKEVSSVDWKNITADSVNPFDPREQPGLYDDFETIRSLHGVLDKKRQDPEWVAKMKAWSDEADAAIGFREEANR